VTDENRGNMSV